MHRILIFILTVFISLTASAQFQKAIDDLKSMSDSIKNLQTQQKQEPIVKQPTPTTTDKNTNVSESKPQVDKSCDIIRKNPAINEFVKSLIEIENIDSNFKFKSELFDSQGILREWVGKKFESNPNLIYPAQQWANKCADELKGTIYLWMFAGIDYGSVPLDSRKALRTLLIRKEEELKPKTKRGLDANGNYVDIVEKPNLDYRPAAVIPDFTSRNYNYNKLSAIYALFLDGSNAVNSVGVEVNEQTKKLLAQYKAVDEKNKAAYAEIKKADDDYKQRQEKIRKGDFSATSNCLEIIDTLAVDDGLNVSLVAHKKLKSGISKLTRYSESKITNTGVGILLNNGFGAEIRTSSKTKWFKKESILVGSNVIVVGHYIDNATLKLTNGSSLQVPVLDAICIQGD